MVGTQLPGQAKGGFLMMHRIFILAAGIAGAAGVATAAGAAHAEASNLSASSAMFFAHAPAFLALALTRPAGSPMRPVDFAGLVLLIGVALFCGDLLARQYLGGRLFPFAAPAGGFLMIAGWLAVAATALAPRR